MANNKVGTCVFCHEKKELIDSNNLLLSENGYGVCRSCSNKNVELEDKQSFINMCLLLNMPFLIDKYDNVLESGKKKVPWSTYKSRISKVWTDGFATSVFDYDEKEKSENFVVTNEMKARWGTGYETNEIEVLELSLRNLYAIKEPATKFEVEKYISNVKLKVALDRAFEENDVKSIPALRKAYEDDCKTLGLEAVLNTKEDKIESVGENIRYWESTKPIPTRKKYEDIDRYAEYLQKWYIKPLKRNFGMASEEEVQELYEGTE